VKRFVSLLEVQNHEEGSIEMLEVEGHVHAMMPQKKLQGHRYEVEEMQLKKVH